MQIKSEQKVQNHYEKLNEKQEKRDQALRNVNKAQMHQHQLRIEQNEKHKEIDRKVEAALAKKERKLME